MKYIKLKQPTNDENSHTSTDFSFYIHRRHQDVVSRNGSPRGHKIRTLCHWLQINLSLVSRSDDFRWRTLIPKDNVKPLSSRSSHIYPDPRERIEDGVLSQDIGRTENGGWGIRRWILSKRKETTYDHEKLVSRGLESRRSWYLRMSDVNLEWYFVLRLTLYLHLQTRSLYLGSLIG